MRAWRHWAWLVATEALTQTQRTSDGMLRIQSVRGRAAELPPPPPPGWVVVGLWVVRPAGNDQLKAGDPPMRIPYAELLPTSFDVMPGVMPGNDVHPLEAPPPGQVRVFLSIVAGRHDEGFHARLFGALLCTVSFCGIVRPVVGRVQVDCDLELLIIVERSLHEILGIVRLG